MVCRRLASASLAALTLAIAPAVLSASDRATEPRNQPIAVQETPSTASAGQFAALKGVKAVPMAADELKAIKGQHVHFITIKNGKVHLAGDIKTENNWSNEWGGTDGALVAPSYHGLCVAHGNGSIFIPTGPTGSPVTLQCPAGS